MKIFQYVMYGFYVVMFLVAGGIGIWLHRKRKGDGR